MARACVIAIALALFGCPDPLPLDEHVFACATHADCGTGAFCVEARCRLFGAASDVVETPDADVVETSPDAVVAACNIELEATRSAEQALLTLERDPLTGEQFLRIRLEGIDTRYPLPDDVVGFDDSAERCCEDACCRLLGPPP